jgi:hypothetical protein
LGASVGANEFGDGGYFCMVGPDGIVVREELGGLVQRFATEEDARGVARHLRKKFAIGEEHITPEMRAHETEGSFWLTCDEWADGISIETEDASGRRYLLVREDGEEFTTGDIDDNVADALVRLLAKFNQRLGPIGGA